MRIAFLLAVTLLLTVLIPGHPAPDLGPNRPPSPPVIAGPSAVTVVLGVNASFTATTSDPEIYDTLYWTWIWGDGTTSSTVGNATNPVSTYGHVWREPGTFFVNVSVSDGYSGPLLCPNPVAVTAVPPPPGTLKGVVRSTDLTPIGGAEVTVSPGGRTSSTNESGGYAFTLSPGTYSITASAPGFGTDMKAGRAVDSGSVTTVDFTLTPLPGVISGTVRTAAGDPVANATVLIVPASGQGSIVLYTVRTDRLGTFSQSVPSGSYLVTVAASGYVAQNRTGVLVAPGQVVTLDFGLAPTAPPSSNASLEAVAILGGVLLVAGLAGVLLRLRRKSS